MEVAITRREGLITSKEEGDNEACLASEDPRSALPDRKNKIWHRETYSGALLFNFLALLLPALYLTLSKLWVANIDSSLIVTTDTYSYIKSIAGTVDSGLPKAAWLVIGDKSSRSRNERFSLAYTVILFQTVLGLILSLSFLGAANTFVGGFVPANVRETSLDYVRISSFSALAVSVETAVSSATRALDKPDVPLVISTIKVACNIVLDFLIISWFHVGSHKPMVNDQASIRLACDLTSAFAGFVYFFFANSFRTIGWKQTVPTLKALKVLAIPSIFLFIESAVRNGLYLWQVSIIVSIGSDYATAWSLFGTIRGTLIMVPVKALNATTLAFVGHNWGEWRHLVGIDKLYPKTDPEHTIQGIIKPAYYSIALGLAAEIPICILFSYLGARPFAVWLGGGDTPISDMTAHIWRTIDWCYVFSAVEVQLSAVLEATRPPWFLYQSLVSCVLYTLPWTIACQVLDLDSSNAWTYQAFALGGSMVFGCFSTIIFVVWWARKLNRGTLRIEPFRTATVE